MKNKTLEVLPWPDDKVAFINQEWLANAEEFMADLRSGNVTHGVIIYRKADGSISFRRFPANHSTYLMGLMMKGVTKLGMMENWDDD